VLDGIVTLREVEQEWSLVDVMKANALLDMRQELERKATDEVIRK